MQKNIILIVAGAGDFFFGSHSNKSIDKNKTYYAVTNDYLAKGGDKMDFLLKSTENHSLDYKLRNMFIAYFTKIDTLNPSVKPRIIFE